MWHFPNGFHFVYMCLWILTNNFIQVCIAYTFLLSSFFFFSSHSLHSSVADSGHPPIPVDSFTESTAMLKKDNGAGLEDEYAVSGGISSGRRDGWPC